MSFILGLLIGLGIGFFVGILLFSAGQLNSEKNAIATGVVKLDRDFYHIKKITITKE